MAVGAKLSLAQFECEWLVDFTFEILIGNW